MIRKMVTIYNTTLSATSQRHFSDGLGGGAVVTKDIPPYSVAVGVPAKVIKSIHES